MAYNEEDYLQLSGIQHFKFCRRQWALIHIENQWAENTRTVEGEAMHTNAHNADFREKRGELLITRDMRIFSATLGISGSCDVVEFRRNEAGITLPDYKGNWLPCPVEYKHGRPRQDTANELQLCAEAMCLEEMLCCEIKEGAIYFGETRQRLKVEFTAELRQEVKACLCEMHDLYKKGYTPKVKPTKACNACSLKEVCVPKLMRNKPVSSYIRERLGDTL